MIDQNSLTLRGRQLAEALAECRTRYESLPLSCVRTALLAASERALTEVAANPAYRLRNLPALPKVDNHAFIWARMNENAARHPLPAPKPITLSKRQLNVIDNNHSQPKKPTINISVTEGIFGRAAVKRKS